MTVSYIPIGFSILQIVLMLTIFRYDTPVFLNQKGETDTLRIFLGKIYKAGEVQKRYDELANPDNNNASVVDNLPQKSIGYKTVCFDKSY